MPAVGREARSRVVLARRLAARPETDAALASGTISVDHARLVTTALAELAAAAGPELANATEGPLLEAAGRCDPARLRREIAHARHALVPAAGAAADDRLHARRHLDVATTFDGAVAVNGVLDPEGGEALLAALAPLAAPSGPEDDRSPRQRRADALVELCRQRLDTGALPALGGERPHVTVLVPLAALSAPIAVRTADPAVASPGRAVAAPGRAAVPPLPAAPSAGPSAVGGPARTDARPGPSGAGAEMAAAETV